MQSLFIILGLMNAEQEERNNNMEEGCGDPVAVLNFSDADGKSRFLLQ